MKILTILLVVLSSIVRGQPQPANKLIYIYLPKEISVKIHYPPRGANYKSFVITINKRWKAYNGLFTDFILFSHARNDKDTSELFIDHVDSKFIKSIKPINIDEFIKLLNKGRFSINSQKVGIIIPSDMGKYNIYYARYEDPFPIE